MPRASRRISDSDLRWPNILNYIMLKFASELLWEPRRQVPSLSAPSGYLACIPSAPLMQYWLIQHMSTHIHVHPCHPLLPVQTPSTTQAHKRKCSLTFDADAVWSYPSCNRNPTRPRASQSAVVSPRLRCIIASHPFLSR